MTKNTKGVLGTKLGMSQVFDADGRMVPVTVIAAGPCVVTAVRTPDANGYSAVQLGYGEIDALLRIADLERPSAIRPVADCRTTFPATAQ